MSNRMHTPIKCLTKYAVYWFVIATLSYFQCAAASAITPEAERTAQKMLHVLDYIAVDYANVVQNGAVTNESEYGEQVEFDVTQGNKGLQASNVRKVKE